MGREWGTEDVDDGVRILVPSAMEDDRCGCSYSKALFGVVRFGYFSLRLMVFGLFLYFWEYGVASVRGVVVREERRPREPRV